MKVYFSVTAEQNLVDLTNYLLEEWGLSVKKKFITKLTNKINQISEQPLSCPKSSVVNNLYKCVVTKQTTIFYQIDNKNKEIQIISVFDTRQNISKLKKLRI